MVHTQPLQWPQRRPGRPSWPPCIALGGGGLLALRLADPKILTHFSAERKFNFISGHPSRWPQTSKTARHPPLIDSLGRGQSAEKGGGTNRSLPLALPSVAVLVDCGQVLTPGGSLGYCTCTQEAISTKTPEENGLVSGSKNLGCLSGTQQ